MPTNAPQSQSNDDVYAVSACILSLNGITSTDTVLDAMSMAATRMPNRGRMYRARTRETDITRAEERRSNPTRRPSGPEPAFTGFLWDDSFLSGDQLGERARHSPHRPRVEVTATEHTLKRRYTMVDDGVTGLDGMFPERLSS